MTKNLLCLFSVVFVCAGCVNIESEEKSIVVTKHRCEKPAQMLRHVVLFKFKDGTTPEQIKEVENAFAALPGKISAIHDFEWGTNVSIENRSEGFTHCFVVTFLNEAGRGEYLPHPAHKEFGKMLGPYLDKVLVVDYWTK